MNRIILLVFLVFSYCMGNSQAISNRGSSAVTVQDARLFAQYNFRPPAFKDTLEANTNLGLDSCGALIFTRTTNTYWLRSCTTPKKWILVGSGSGGNFIDSLKRSRDSVYGRINNVFRFQYKDSIGGGVTSVGSGYGIVNSPTTITSTGSVIVDTSTSGLSGKYLRIIDTTTMLSKYLRKTDTASLSNRINLKLSISDTSAMLTPYLRKIDTASLSNRINLKLSISDTSAMLSPYLRKIDTASLSNRINLKLSISDTSAMLTPYLRKVDTASLSNRINLKLSISDTSAMLSPYLRKVDTASLSNRINLKLSISDTSAMLTPYLRKIDTASLSNRINLKLSISDTSAMLTPYLRKIDTASLSNRINLKLAISDTSAMLNPYLRKIDSSRWVSSITRTPGKDSIIFFKNGDRFAIKDSVGTNPAPVGYYGAFQDTTTQTAASINTAYAVKLNTTDLTNGVSVVNDGSGNPTKIRLANTGIYNIQFSLQLEKTGGSGNMTADIWLRKNSVDIPSTTGKVVLTGSANASPVIAAWNYVLDLAAGDSIQLMWAVSNINVAIVAAVASPPHPSTPSVILTVTQQSGIMAGTGITAINSLTGSAQTMVVDSSNTTFKITSTGTSHTFTIPNASTSGVTRGLISNTQYNTFNNKIGAGDTAAMLTPYLRKVDTTAMLTPYLRKVDTTAMLSPYLRKIDTASLSNRINLKLAISDTSVFQRKSLASYTFQANNTTATANATSQIFKDTTGTYTGTPTWSGGTAPTTLTNAVFSYTQIGKVVTLRITMIYTNQGNLNSRVQIPLMTNMPTPLAPSGYTSTSDIFGFGAGYFGNVINSIVAGTTGSSVCFLRGTATGSELVVDRGTTGSGKYVWATISYFTN